jgi:hypothetical protein
MKLALGLMVCDGDLPFLKLHLPVIASRFDELIVVADDNQPDLLAVTDWIASLPIPSHLYGHQWIYNFSEKANLLIRIATDLGCDGLIRLDPDELLMPEHIPVLHDLLAHYSVIRLPRWNFWIDRLHTDGRYPDLQARCMRLDAYPVYEGAIHEQLLINSPIPPVTIDYIHLYHYGNLTMKYIATRQLRYINFERHQQKLPPLDTLPLETRFDLPMVPFTGLQPLDPDIVGKYAPFTED